MNECVNQQLVGRFLTL